MTIGSFLGTRSGFEFRNFPLTDGSGQNRIRLNLDGITTLRLRQVTPDGDGETRFLNYLVFIRVGDKEVRRAGIASVSPAPNSTEDTVAPVIRVQIQNADTTVNASTIQLTVNGSAVVPQITSDANGATVTYPLNPLPVSGAVNSATVRFRDNQNQEITSTWSFAVGYKSLDPANRVFGTPGERGFSVHVVQSPAGAALDNSLARAEEQIKANSSIARAVDVTEIVQVINMNKQAGGSKGAFPDDAGVPGIDPATTGNNDFTVESVAYLALQKGVYRFGMISDDGYKLNSGQSLHDGSSNPLAFHNGGPGNETVDFVVTESGLYPVRFLWYERGGDAYGELSAINITTGERLLINDPAAEGAIKAYINVVVAPVIQSTGALGTAFGTDAGIVVDAIAKQVRIPIQAGSKFVKISWPSGVSLKTIHQVGNTLVVAYE